MTASYESRAQAYAIRRDAELRQSARVSRLRLATFLPGAALLLFTLSNGSSRVLMASLALFAVFGALVVWHARIEGRAEWYDALRIVNQRGAARRDRRWSELPPGDAPPSVDLAHHPYANDLDLFGHASLFQWLGPAATPSGGATLASWLLEPAAPADIAARQTAITELAGRRAWREELGAHGILASGARQAEIDVFLAWAEGPPLPMMRGWLLRVVVTALTASNIALLALAIAGVPGGALFPLPIVAGIALSFWAARAIGHEFHQAGAGQSALARYAGLFEHATATSFAAPKLRDVHDRLSVEGRSAPVCMRRLHRILGFADLRSGSALLHFPIQALTLWDFHVLSVLDRWRSHVGTHIRSWMEAVGELDALSALATVRDDNPQWCLPAIETRPSLSATALGHPLIADDRRVPNDVEVGPAGTVLLVTGSNMSGKSTLLRAVGLNAVLAEAGACACAASLRMPPLDLQTSLRVQDSLELGLSYFMAALARLKGVVDAAEHERPGRTLLYLLDEILQGTNSAERAIAVRAVARHLLDAGAIGAMTTHDLNIAAEEPLKSAARLVHFTEIVDEDGAMRFDYRLRDGLATSRNALRLMQLIGIDLK